MAIYSKKSKDPTEVALSAIQDALNIRDADAKGIARPSAAVDADCGRRWRDRGRRRGLRASQAAATCLIDSATAPGTRRPRYRPGRQ